MTADLEDARAAVRRRIRVMVVDDSADHRTLITRRLEGAGMQVTAIGTAAEALERIGEVDLVLLDYRLPGVSGLDALRAIRRRRQPPSVVMVTSAGSTEIAVDAMRAGAIHYVTKDRGYLDALPEVVERAWVHHDLAVRASELQRLAQLVTSARDRDQLSLEVVEGAARLLRASSCALLLEEDGLLRPVVAHGRDPRGLTAFASHLAEQEPDRDAWMADGCFVVPLPGGSGDQPGYLLIWPEDGGPPADEEQQLALVFASFAGIALHNLRRLVEVQVPPVTVVGEASLIRRSLANLLTNAVKFSDVGTAIRVAAAVDGTHVTVAVTDRGIGLPDWEAARVFNPFFRARSSVANAVRGSGIGLALVREYVRTMGGEVAVRSIPGEGSTFSFTLPRPVVVDLNALEGPA